MIVKTNEAAGKNLASPFNIKIGYLDGSQVYITNESMRTLVTKLKKGTTYTFVMSKESTMMRYAFSREYPYNQMNFYTNTFFSYKGYTTFYPRQDITFTSEEDCYLLITFWRNTSAISINEAYGNIQIEEGSIATPYEPFKGYKSYLTADSDKLMEEMN